MWRMRSMTGQTAVMLSGESAAGKLSGGGGGDDGDDRGGDGARRYGWTRRRGCSESGRFRGSRVAETICECMAHSTQDLDLAAIAIFTETGSTARLLSKYRPEPPIYALSPYQAVVNRAVLLWGTYPMLCARERNIDRMVNLAEDILEREAGVQKRQVVGIVAGTSTRSGATNFLRLHMVGDRDEAPAE